MEALIPKSAVIQNKVYNSTAGQSLSLIKEYLQNNSTHDTLSCHLHIYCDTLNIQTVVDEFIAKITINKDGAEEETIHLESLYPVYTNTNELTRSFIDIDRQSILNIGHTVERYDNGMDQPPTLTETVYKEEIKDFFTDPDQVAFAIKARNDGDYAISSFNDYTVANAIPIQLDFITATDSFPQTALTQLYLAPAVPW